MNTSSTPLRYQSGFGNEFATEALPSALPQGRNSPQRAPLNLYPELISGTAFTAPRHENRRSWLYRRQPSVATGRYQPCAQAHWRTGADRDAALSPEPMRWNPFPVGDAPCDFVDGMCTLAANGDAATQTGMAAHIYLVNRSMQRRAFVNADGEMLLVPQQGGIRLVTEMGVLDVKPGEVALVPRESRSRRAGRSGLWRVEDPGTDWRVYRCLTPPRRPRRRKRVRTYPRGRPLSTSTPWT